MCPVDIWTAILSFRDLRELGMRNLRTEAIVPAEAHDHRPPEIRIDSVLVMWHQERRYDMHTLDPDLQTRDALQGAFLAPFVLSIIVLIRHDGVRADESGFQLDRALSDARWRNSFRCHRRQPGDAELVGFI